MRGKAIGAVAAVVLTVAGGWGYDRWQTGRLAGCEERGARLATLSILDAQPGDLTANRRYSGCDVDRAIGYAGDTYYGPLDQPTVAAFTARAATQDGWRATGTPDDPASIPNAATYCGEKEIGGRTVYLRTAVGRGTYEVHVSEHPDSGFACD